MAFIIAVISIYYGALFNVENNLDTLVFYVVDFDGQLEPYNTSGIEPIVGPGITKLARQLIESPTSTVGFIFPSLSQFDYDPIQVRQAVYDWDAWGAIIINANATAMLQSAVRNGNSSYDPLGACQLIYMDSRDDTNWYVYQEAKRDYICRTLRTDVCVI